LNDIELKDFYERRFDLFLQESWKDLIEDLEELSKTTGDITRCEDLSDLWYKRGQLDIINYLINLEELTKQSYEELDNA
jgi:hypothetical protein